MDTYKKCPLFGFFVLLYIKPVIIKSNEENGDKKMSRFNEFQRKQLENNPNVSHVTDKNINYSPAFKIRAVKESLAGKGPKEIFIENGFDIAVIGVKKPKSSLERWRKTYELFGEEGFYTERRGKGSACRPSSKELTVEEKLKKAEARIAFLEMENDFLKKLEELERQAKRKKN
jgi:transposase